MNLQNIRSNLKYRQSFASPMDHGVHTVSLLNVFSLDAPLIAIVWQFVISKSISLELSPHHHLILGLSVWLAYSADRFSEPHSHDLPKAKRHEIFSRHKLAFSSLWFASFIIVLCCSVRYLEVDCILLGLPLFALCMGNFILCRFESRYGFASKCAKEFRTASIFSLGCVFFPFYETPLEGRELLSYWLVPFVLFLINCLCVSQWEWREDEKRENLSWLQKRPEFLRTLIWAKYPCVVLCGLIACRYGMAGNLFMHAFCILSSVILIDRLLAGNQGKREVIDWIYWLLPLTLLGMENVFQF